MAVVFVLAVSAQAQAPESKWAKIDSNKIHYYDIGNSKSKNALVLVHCWTCNAEFWKDNYNAFPNHRVIAMDLPGHGLSDKPKIDYSIEFFAKSVDAVMKKAGVKKAVFAGHSMGTPIIRRYYELYPEKTLGLILVDGMLPTANPDLSSFIRSSMLATPDYVGSSAMKLMIDDAYATHDKIDIPVLAVMATSPYWPKDIEQQYKAIAPKIDFQMWTGVSHFLHMEKPKEFNEQVSIFLTKNKVL